MTVMTDPRPSDTGELRIPEFLAAPAAAPLPMNDGATAAIKPPTLLLPTVPRRPRVNPTVDTGVIELPWPTGAELAVAARPDFLPTPPPDAPMPPVPAPKPADDMAAAQPVGYIGRHRTVEVIPARRWPNRAARLFDLLTGWGAR